jgi:WD40 repeat protein/serine/threonine protein kinase
MELDQDSHPGGERTTGPALDPAVPPTAVAESPHGPMPQGAAREPGAALTETLAQPHKRAVATRTAPDRAAVRFDSTLKHYEIIRTLGEGGMGTVFLARDTKLGRLVAIKALLRHSGRGTARFLAEARATARCKHENIVVIYEVDELRGTPYMVLEYLEGRTLRAWMAQREPAGTPEPPEGKPTLPGLTSPSLAVELMIPVVRALSCAHKLGIVHRDLKPENILLTDAGPVKVLDFGIAKRLEASELSAIVALEEPLARGVGLTQEGALMGTLPYMSPEQWRSEEIDPRSDLWAVGIILFELCIGGHPLPSITMNALAQVGDLDAPMPRVSDRRPDVGPLGAVIDRCLQKRKAERFGSADELLAALSKLLHGNKELALGDAESPFAGLSAFQEADAARFFGREGDVVSLIGRLRHQRLVAVAGPSGAGKSSCVRAGVIPALKRSGERWEAHVVRPGRRPLAGLADVLAQVADMLAQVAAATPEGARPAAPEASAPDALASALRTQPGLLGARLRARCRRQGGRHRILLFVDQFEELYTLGTDPAERAAFVACLEGAADDASSPLRVMLSIRSDFLDRMADDRHFMAEVTRGLVFLPPMGRDGLREALTRPIEAAGHRFESEDMVESMLSALSRTRSPLPLLQFTAAKLWEARDRPRKLLTQDSYEKLGGVAGALSTHADAVLAGLSSVEKRLCRAVFLRLVTPERTRAVVSLAELRGLAEDSGAVEQVVHRLADARLLLIEIMGEREGTTVELVHESLIERWAKLKQWLDESEQDTQFLARLRAAAQQWEASGQIEGLLWRDRAAEDARAWLRARRAEQSAGEPVGPGPREERYLQAVVALSERARRTRRWIAMGVFTILSVVAVVVSLLALRANREAVQARNATRMATARELEPNDPSTALALLREIEPPAVPRGWADLALVALHSGITSRVLPHPDMVSSASWSPDGKRIVTACFDGTARVWSADGTGEPRVLRGHERGVTSAAFSPDGRRIVTSSWDKTTRVWSADGTGEPLVLRGHEGLVYSAAFSPDGQRIVTASDDKTARVWNADGTGEALVLRGHEVWVATASFSPDGKRIVTASKDKTARVWNADGTGEPLVFRSHDDEVTSASFSPDGKHIITTSDDKTAHVWNADGTGEPLVLRGHEVWVVSASFSPDGKRIVTASEDRTARVWNADGTDELLVLRGHAAQVHSAAFSPDGKRIVTASYDKTARVWSADGADEPLVFRGHQGLVHSASFSPSSERIVTAAEDSTVQVWNADGTGEPLVFRGPQDRFHSASWSPDGKRIVTAAEDKTVQVWNADGTGEPLILRGHQSRLHSAAFSPDGQRIASACADRTVRVWNADGTGVPRVLGGHEGMVYTASWSPDGKRIVSASSDKSARVWDADGTGELLVLRGHESAVQSAAFSPDGQRIVTASDDKTARVWSADGAGELLALRGHESAVQSASWSPDGKRIVTASDDKTARVWSADGTGEPLVLRGHDNRVHSAAWSPDGKRIVTSSWDRTVRVWTDLAPLRGTDDPKLWIAISSCMSIERRIELLNVSEATAQADREACQRRVDAARAAPAGPN